MERLVTVKDIRERYGCSGTTARKYIRQMFHYENPLVAPKSAVEQWERNRAVTPGKRMNVDEMTGRVIVPRKRD